MKKNVIPSSLFSLLMGLLAVTPVLFDGIGYLSFVVFIPYLIFLLTRRDETRLRFYYLSGLFFFLGYYMGAFSFFTAMYPLDFAGLGTFESIAVIFAAVVLLPLFQAWFAAFAVLLIALMKKKNVLRFPLAFSLAFSALYTLFAYAQNFTWAGVPWASAAVGIASSPILLQSASILGASFLVFLILFCNAALAEGYIAFRECKDKSAVLCVLCALALFVSNLSFGALRLASRKAGTGTVTVALLQGNVSATEDIRVATHLNICRTEAFKAAAEADVDLMLWAESVLTYAIQSDEGAQIFFENIAQRTGSMQFVGTFSAEPTPEGEEGYYNVLMLYYPDGTADDLTYKKRRPVPFGEYVPMAWLFERVLPALTEISMLSRNTTPGKDTALFYTEDGVFGGLICFDSIYPALARESVRDGAELILLSTDDSWFDGSFAKSLHFRHSVLRAVENGRSVVRTGNTGLSGTVDAYGETQILVECDEVGHGIAEVELRNTTTVYTAVGEIFPLLLLGFLVLLPIPLEKLISCKKKEL